MTLYTFTSFHECRSLLASRIAEPPPGRIQLLTGPRQVGKTTLLLDLEKTHAPRAIYAACDAPEAAVAGWWERLWTRASAAAERHGQAVVLLDEIQHVSDWSVRLKAEWDRLRRRHTPIHVATSGSSALRLASGSRESLAGRFERITLSHWSASSLATAFGVDDERAADLVVARGSYPGAMEFIDDEARWRAYVRDAIVEPAIGRDILALNPIRKPALLRQVFAAAVASPAQIVSLQKMQGSLEDAGALETIASYLAVLEEAYLIAALQKHAVRPLRRRSAPPKLVILNNALLAATDPRGIPDPAREPDRYGAWVENACIAFAHNSGQRVAYWREEPLELDAVTEGSWGKLAIEIKSGAFSSRDLGGLLEFVRRHRSYRPLVIHGDEGADAAERVGVEAVSWRRFLLEGPPD